MKSKVLSSFCIGLSFGIMLASSYASYHSVASGSIALVTLVIGIFTADLSGPNDPEK